MWFSLMFLKLCARMSGQRKHMPSPVESFGETAKGLARNPLGIIALFIVLVYGFAALVTAFSSAFTAGERQPLIYFLVCFPVLVLAIFTWLVAKHSGKLYSPSDFKDETNWVQMQLEAVASLTAAAAKSDPTSSGPEIHRIVRAVTEASQPRNADGWKNHILWVDDRPQNNTYEQLASNSLWRYQHRKPLKNSPTRNSLQLSPTWDAKKDRVKVTSSSIDSDK
jgi:hypothetical protein